VTGGARRLVFGATVARLAVAALRARPAVDAARWERANFRDRRVSLLAGPALALAAGVSSRSPVAASIAAVGAGAVGAYDDTAGSADTAKGLRGHLGALRRGRVSTGAVKLVGIPMVALAAAAVHRPRRPVDVLLGAGIIAAAANAMNLFDLRPGRALKVGIGAAAALGEAGVVGACAAVLPDDLAERSMLGDAGANALGAALGAAVVSRVTARRARAACLVALGTITGASELVSFSEVIDRSRPLRAVDRLGRRA
jgi:UDP-N-acetylmuramyl pentapeptide phosphotransferase/UDP-N-acetylglucosamine-1-phosphate transferase